MEQQVNDVIEVTVEELEKHIADMGAVRKLVETKEWKRVIDELYFEEEAIRLVNASGNLALTPDQKGNIMGMMAGIPFLKSFVNRVIATGAQAEQDLKDYEEESAAAVMEVN